MPVLEIWWARTIDASSELEGVLSQPERARMMKYVHSADRRRFLSAWSLARIVLGDHLGVAPSQVPIFRRCLVCGSLEHGKPHLAADAHLEFSLSHAGDRVAIALAWGTPVGIDVEETTRSIDDGAHQVLSADEPLTTGFGLLRCWVRKEAVSKATGYGLNIPMRDYSVSAAWQPARLLSWPADAELVGKLTLLDLAAEPGYVAAVAAIGSVEKLTIHHASLEAWARW